MRSSPGSSRNTGCPELADRTVVLLGDPVGHSLSAVFQNAGFRALGLPARYEGRRVRAAELASVIAGLRADETVLGANVTIPHKLAVAPLLDGLGPEAQALRAVNTISRRGTRLIGSNTDVAGFQRALSEALDLPPLPGEGRVGAYIHRIRDRHRLPRQIVAAEVCSL